MSSNKPASRRNLQMFMFHSEGAIISNDEHYRVGKVQVFLAKSCHVLQCQSISDQHEPSIEDKQGHPEARSSKVCNLLSGLAAIAVQQPYVPLVSGLVHFLFHFAKDYGPLQCTEYSANACRCRAVIMLLACSQCVGKQLQASNAFERLPKLGKGLTLAS